LLTSILDSRFKKIKGWQEEEKEKAIALLRSEYTFSKNKKHLNHNQESTNKNRNYFKNKENTISDFKSCLFEKEEEEIINKDKIVYYFKF
ncbi:24670_t:CDS:1, partial [Gigaspora margarita]